MRVLAVAAAVAVSFSAAALAAPARNVDLLRAFEARPGAKLPGKANLRLAGGDPAVYHAFSCGASCSPTSFWFTHGGVLYSWQVKDIPKAPKATLARLAAEAIEAGPR